MTNNYNYQEMEKVVCKNTLAYAILQPKMDLNSIDTSKFSVKAKDRKFENKISTINFVTCGDKEYLSLKYTNKYLILKKNKKLLSKQIEVFLSKTQKGKIDERGSKASLKINEKNAQNKDHGDQKPGTKLPVDLQVDHESHQQDQSGQKTICDIPFHVGSTSYG